MSLHFAAGCQWSGGCLGRPLRPSALAVEATDAAATPALQCAWQAAPSEAKSALAAAAEQLRTVHTTALTEAESAVADLALRAEAEAAPTAAAGEATAETQEGSERLGQEAKPSQCD